MAKPAFILASSSPRRIALLNDIGIVPDKIIPADIDETPLANEKPRALAERLSLEKLQAITETGAYILAADTVVGVGRRILPKAETDADVRMCLQLMSGRRHHVYTGVALRAPDGKITSRTSESTVIFRSLSDDDISAYIKTGEGIGKAGGYAVQGAASGLIRFISGSYTGIVGLPLFEVAQLLRGAGWAL
jgi:septum formation protein